MIEYSVGSSSQILVLTDHVLAHFREHRQVRWRSKEAGGQIFARIDGLRIVICEATGPRLSDRRGWNSYVPDRRAEQVEITSRHKLGLEYVGDWHTHREDVPEPSETDVQNIGECVRRSKHELRGFLLIVVGRANPPLGLHVSMHDGKVLSELRPRLPGSS
ncbi:MAG: Mov34/MPN/PAD-1 family protein [Planctomycetes bacterium]|nr:Mov34/MPN/PAD-1 family protein [Planctomycetota bacterium]